MENKKNYVFIGIIGIILAFTAIAIFSTFIKKTQTLKTTQEINQSNDLISQREIQPKESVVLNKDEKIYWPKNFSISVLPNWNEISADKVNLPKGMNGIQFAYQKQGTDCVFAFLHSLNIMEKYKQTSFATRVFTKENDQLDASWYLFKDDLPKNFKFKWEGRQPLEGEVRINNYPVFYNDSDQNYSNFFALFSNNNKTVSDSCDSEFSSMLESINSKYENVKIGLESNGIAFIDSQSNKPTYLKFISNQDGIIRIVSQLDIKNSQNEVGVYNGKIYYISDGNLITMDIISGKVENVLDKLSTGSDVVNEYYFAKDKIYYLFGKNCKEYLAKCNLDLFMYDLNNKKSNLLAKNLPYRDILGFDEKNSLLQMLHSEGDAGCFWAQTGNYDFSKNKIVDKQEFNGCNEDKESKRFSKFMNSFDNKLSGYDFIMIKKGKIVIPDSKIATPGGWWSVQYMR